MLQVSLEYKGVLITNIVAEREDGDIDESYIEEDSLLEYGLELEVGEGGLSPYLTQAFPSLTSLEA